MQQSFSKKKLESASGSFFSKQSGYQTSTAIIVLQIRSISPCMFGFGCPFSYLAFMAKDKIFSAPIYLSFLKIDIQSSITGFVA